MWKKNEHPCQFPVEWIERLVLSLSNESGCVFDPFLGVETSVIAAVRHRRKGSAQNFHPKYVENARHQISQELDDTLRPRPVNKAIYAPKQADNSLAQPSWEKDFRQPNLLKAQTKDEIAVLENRAGAFFTPPAKKTCKQHKSNRT